MNYFEDIESYLDGSMDGQNRKAFEAELQRNPGLARETELRRSVELLLASGPEDAFRQNLNVLGERYKNTSSGSNMRWIWIIGAIFFVSMLAWVLLQKPEAKPGFQPVSPQDQALDTIRQQPQIQKQAPPKKEDPQAEPIAASFRPNPALESMIGSQLRDGNVKITVLKPSKNARLNAKNGLLPLEISGRVEDTEKMDTPFRLKLFSNKKTDYEDGRTLLSAPLVFLREEQHYNFQVLQKLRLTPGLFYYLIENEESGAVNVVGKFEVR